MLPPGVGGAPPPRPPANVGPVTIPSANAGNQVAAHAGIKNAAELLQQSLLQLPMGSDEHTKLLNIVKQLGTMTADSAPDPAAQMQSLVQMARAASQRGAPPGLNSAMPATPVPPPAAGPVPAPA